VFRRKFIKISNNVPMIGSLAFGVIDRGTNIIELRPTTVCPLSCIFCSVNAGPKSRARWAEYLVEKDLLIQAIKETVKYKDIDNIEVHIDGMGEPGVYPKLADLVQELKSINKVKTVSIQTRLFMFNEDKIRDLAEAGLDRVNLSVDALNEDLAKKLANTSWYNVSRVLRLAEYTVRNTSIDVIISPVWLPGINDIEIERIIEWSLRAGLGKKWPPILIQKYIPHKRGRKVNVKVMSWSEFYRRLKILEKKFNIKLIYSNEIFNIVKTQELPKPYKIGDVVKVEVIERGIFLNEYLAVPLKRKFTNISDRVITLIASSRLEDEIIGARLKVKIIENKHNIYLAKLT